MLQKFMRSALSFTLTLTIALSVPLPAKAETHYGELYPFSPEHYYEENNSAYLERLDKTKKWLAAIPTDERALDWYKKSGNMYPYYVPNNAREEILSLAEEITAGKEGDFDKALAIHDWVSANIHYDFGALERPFLNADPTSEAVRLESQKLYEGLAYRALKTKLAACGGYTALTHALLSAADIPSVSMSYDNHSANLAWVDGRWLDMDTTWDSDHEPVSVAPESRYVSRAFFDSPIENWGDILFDEPISPVPDWFTTDIATGVCVKTEGWPHSLMDDGNTNSDIVVAYENGEVCYFDLRMPETETFSMQDIYVENVFPLPELYGEIPVDFDENGVVITTKSGKTFELQYEIGSDFDKRRCEAYGMGGSIYFIIDSVTVKNGDAPIISTDTVSVK